MHGPGNYEHHRSTLQPLYKYNPTLQPLYKYNLLVYSWMSFAHHSSRTVDKPLHITHSNKLCWNASVCTNINTAH
jgi:hypothetical protein